MGSEQNSFKRFLRFSKIFLALTFVFKLQSRLDLLIKLLRPRSIWMWFQKKNYIWNGETPTEQLETHRNARSWLILVEFIFYKASVQSKSVKIHQKNILPCVLNSEKWLIFTSNCFKLYYSWASLFPDANQRLYGCEMWGNFRWKALFSEWWKIIRHVQKESSISGETYSNWLKYMIRNWSSRDQVWQVN